MLSKTWKRGTPKNLLNLNEVADPDGLPPEWGTAPAKYKSTEKRKIKNIAKPKYVPAQNERLDSSGNVVMSDQGNWQDLEGISICTEKEDAEEMEKSQVRSSNYMEPNERKKYGRQWTRGNTKELLDLSEVVDPNESQIEGKRSPRKKTWAGINKRRHPGKYEYVPQEYDDSDSLANVASLDLDSCQDIEGISFRRKDSDSGTSTDNPDRTMVHLTNSIESGETNMLGVKGEKDTAKKLLDLNEVTDPDNSHQECGAMSNKKQDTGVCRRKHSGKHRYASQQNETLFIGPESLKDLENISLCTDEGNAEHIDRNLLGTMYSEKGGLKKTNGQSSSSKRFTSNCGPPGTEHNCVANSVSISTNKQKLCRTGENSASTSTNNLVVHTDSSRSYSKSIKDSLICMCSFLDLSLTLTSSDLKERKDASEAQILPHLKSLTDPSALSGHCLVTLQLPRPLNDPSESHQLDPPYINLDIHSTRAQIDLCLALLPSISPCKPDVISTGHLEYVYEGHHIVTLGMGDCWVIYLAKMYTWTPTMGDKVELMAVKVFVTCMCNLEDIIWEAAMGKFLNPTRALPYCHGMIGLHRHRHYHPLAIVSDFFGDPSSNFLHNRSQVDHEISPKFNRTEWVTIAHRCVQLLGKIHAKGVIYNNMKCDNILIQKTGSGVKIALADLGLARLVGNNYPIPLADMQKSKEKHKFLHLAPEVLSQGKASFQSDIYAFGRVLHVVQFYSRVDLEDMIVLCQSSCEDFRPTAGPLARMLLHKSLEVDIENRKDKKWYTPVALWWQKKKQVIDAIRVKKQ